MGTFATGLFFHVPVANVPTVPSVSTVPAALLRFETRQLSGRLALETNRGGLNKYYHLYNSSITFKAMKESRIVHTIQCKKPLL